MHEMGIATEIVRIVNDSIPADITAPKVAKVNLKVGKLAAVVPQSLLFCFEIAAKETPAEGALLDIEEIPVTARCYTCEAEWEVDRPVFQCPRCDGTKVEMLTGRELDIESIELEEDDETHV